MDHLEAPLDIKVVVNMPTDKATIKLWPNNKPFIVTVCHLWNNVPDTSDLLKVVQGSAWKLRSSCSGARGTDNWCPDGQTMTCEWRYDWNKWIKLGCSNYVVFLSLCYFTSLKIILVILIAHRYCFQLTSGSSWFRSPGVALKIFSWRLQFRL